MVTLKDTSNLNELEVDIYKYILNNRKSVSYMRIRELADETHVSTSTILRFCRKLGCDGFSEFKIKLKMELESSLDIEIKDDQSIILEFFNRTNTDEFKKDIRKAAEELSKYNTIFCVGIGSSGALAKYAARYFSGLGSFALEISDPFYPTERIAGQDGISLLFSVEGESPDVIEHLNRLKRCGGKAISITNSKSCTLATLSDLNLNYYVQIQKNGYHQLTTQVPVIYIIEALGKELIELNKK
ncbi:MurR/RpiR family transcriptional regulator [uncultured Clostridium sp.]|uniref:MurR/RpiR family transcriptional regulator n=1 Tax=uncultured Clostridium sp. TaxID=59620 RepID=UPI002610FED0|nr:MurR/RpiR family transcriptional regulator [uncultured Clostridium sp.]